jgi:hypothetical protein
MPPAQGSARMAAGDARASTAARVGKLNAPTTDNFINERRPSSGPVVRPLEGGREPRPAGLPPVRVARCYARHARGMCMACTWHGVVLGMQCSRWLTRPWGHPEAAGRDSSPVAARCGVRSVRARVCPCPCRQRGVRIHASMQQAQKPLAGEEARRTGQRRRNLRREASHH